MADGCSLLILAGGASRRMGRDKAVLPAGDGTMVERLVVRLSPVVDEVLIAGGFTSADGARLISDRIAGLGPLAGMQAGLGAARNAWVWVVACDLPDVEPGLAALLRSMAVDVDAVVPRVAGEVQGLCALYRQSLHERIEPLLQSPPHSVKALLENIRVRYLDEGDLRSVDPELRSFRNLNTAADYEAWLRTR